MERDKSLYYKEGYKYWVNRPYHIKIDIHPKELICISYKTIDVKYNEVEIPIVTLSQNGMLIVYTGYVWDGASGCTIDTLSSMIGSLVHDVGYQLIRLGLIDKEYKKYFDKLLHDICTEDGMWSIRADCWEWAVNNFGSDACKPSAEHLEMVAP